MNKARKSPSRSYTGPTAQMVNLHSRTANLMLYRLYTTRCIACSRMSPAEAAYRNAQYELFGIKARWASTYALKIPRSHKGALWMGREIVHA